MNTIHSNMGSTSCFNRSSVNEEKYSKMKNLIVAIEGYLETKTEDKNILINQHLQALGLSLDLTVFDPHTNIAGKFFISLYDLMNALEPRSLTSWYCVDVLSNACKNHAARHALIQTYQFLPCLARLIGDQLTTEKKMRLLSLMQDLTCGIKVYWLIPHITHLITTLCKWVETQDQDIITLSLGVLVNLLYKNVTTIYILQRNVDLKKFLRMCLALKGPIIEVYVCQVTIILENISGYVPAEVLPKLIDSTFGAVIEAYEKLDNVLLKQIVEFFMESVRNNHDHHLSCYNMYGERVGNILEMIDNNSNDTSRDPECLSVILDFIHFLIELKVPEISSLYTRIIPITLKWIQEATVSYQALAVLRTIAINVDKKDNTILESLIVELPVFLLVLNSPRDNGVTIHTEYNRRLGALLQLLTAMVQVKSIRAKVTATLQEETFTRIFTPLLGDDSPRSNEYNCSIDAINLYVYALALVGELVACDKSWIGFMNNLLGNKQIQVILAQAICQSSSNVKKLAIELSGRFCSDGVSLALTNLQSIISTGDNSSNSVSSPHTVDLGFNLIEVKQSERLDGILDSVESLIVKNDIGNLATSELMEFYNYKISHLSQAERAALCSVEAVNKHCSHLQHRISRLTYEHTRLQQSEFFTVQKLEETIKKKEEMSATIKDLHNRIEVEKGKYKACNSQLLIKEKLLGECEASLAEVTKVKNSMEEQLARRQQLFTRVQENCQRLEKNVEKKEEQLKKANDTITDYSKQMHDLEKCLATKQKQLDDTLAALQVKSSILESITKMANSQLN